jgi:HSP20 family molecular chaperone IbpA
MIVRHRSPFVSRSHPVVRAFDGPVDRAFDQLTQSFFETRRRLPTVDSSWSDGSLVLTVDLPGVPSEAVEVEVAGRALSIRVRTDELQWERTVQVGTSVDPDKVSARHVDGRLTVTVGTVDAPAPRTIAINTNPATPAIESASAEDAATDETSSTTSEGSGAVEATESTDQSTDTSSTG